MRDPHLIILIMRMDVQFHRHKMPMESHGRLFNCNRCRRQIVICSPCDRGNIYCLDCSTAARAASVRAAGVRYQKTFRGRRKHSERQRRYQQRQKIKMTHQGSPDLSPCDLLLDEPNGQAQAILVSVNKELSCHFCGNRCSPYLRLGFQHHRVHNERPASAAWPFGP